MEEFKFKHTLKEEDFIKNMMYQVFGRHPFNRIFLLFVAPVLGIGIFIMMMFIGEHYFTIYLITVLLIFMGPGLYVLIPTFARRAFKRNSNFVSQNEITFADDLMEVVNERGNTKYFYSDFKEARESPEQIFIYISKSMVVPLSKDQLGNDISEKIKEALIEKIGKNCKFKD